MSNRSDAAKLRRMARIVDKNWSVGGSGAGMSVNGIPGAPCAEDAAAMTGYSINKLRRAGLGHKWNDRQRSGRVVADRLRQHAADTEGVRPQTTTEQRKNARKSRQHIGAASKSRRGKKERSVTKFCCVPTSRGSGGQAWLAVIAALAVIGIGAWVYDLILGQMALIDMIVDIVAGSALAVVAATILIVSGWAAWDFYSSRQAVARFAESNRRMDEKQRKAKYEAIAAQKQADYSRAITGDVEHGLLTPVDLGAYVAPTVIDMKDYREGRTA